MSWICLNSVLARTACVFLFVSCFHFIILCEKEEESFPVVMKLDKGAIARDA